MNDTQSNISLSLPGLSLTFIPNTTEPNAQGMARNDSNWSKPFNFLLNLLENLSLFKNLFFSLIALMCDVCACESLCVCVCVCIHVACTEF